MPDDNDRGSGGDDGGLPPALGFLGDRDAFLRRYVLSLLLQPPPSRRRPPPPAPSRKPVPPPIGTKLPPRKK